MINRENCDQCSYIIPLWCVCWSHITRTIGSVRVSSTIFIRSETVEHSGQALRLKWNFPARLPLYWLHFAPAPSIITSFLYLDLICSSNQTVSGFLFSRIEFPLRLRRVSIFPPACLIVLLTREKRISQRRVAEKFSPRANRLLNETKFLSRRSLRSALPGTHTQTNLLQHPQQQQQRLILTLCAKSTGLFYWVVRSVCVCRRQVRGSVGI
jgi:hypothetical protein